MAAPGRPGASRGPASPRPAGGVAGLAEPLLGLRTGEGSFVLPPLWSRLAVVSAAAAHKSLLPFFWLEQPLESGGVARGAEPVGVVELVPSNVEGGHRGSQLSSTGHPGRDLMTDPKQVREKDRQGRGSGEK